jgi:hypothetical protein
MSNVLIHKNIQAEDLDFQDQYMCFRVEYFIRGHD